MEVLVSEDHYIIVDGEYGLWCSRHNGLLTPKPSSEIQHLDEPPMCLGNIFGVIGKFQAHPDADLRLVLIKQQVVVGRLPGDHEVFKIQKIGFLSLGPSEPPLELELLPCTKHGNSNGGGQNAAGFASMGDPTKGLQKTWNSIKTATSQVKPRKKDMQRDREKFEKRIFDELSKMFNDTDSFYYSLTGDLTNSLQRQHAQGGLRGVPLWKRVDDRFFWNRHMLADLFGVKVRNFFGLSAKVTFEFCIQRMFWDCENMEADHWIIPIIQGFVQIEKCWIDVTEDLDLTPLHDANAGPMEVKQPPSPQQQGREYMMMLISRRSRFRAGTRYKRRGVDEAGKCANYVETEQIFEYSPHLVSFVQVRGSVPVFWSQPGYKYRPPPRLDRGEEETQVAFEKHFQEEVSLYGAQVLVSLVEQAGKEKVISDCYLNHIFLLDSPSLVYVTFDFHEYCRGMRFENVSVLIESIKDLIRDMRYCWLDSQGLICDQQGAFRVNCIDCLDRTNIVQTALAKTVMDIQFVRLGLLPPEGMLPAGCRRVFQIMWANNGDIISRQYAGTVALKGDFTRTGERRLAGVMKDGYNSANRYYMNRFKDAYRQATIDLMLGCPVTEDVNALSPEREEAENDLELSEQEHHERVKQLIEDCKKILIPETEIVLGGWALIDADPVTGDPGQQDMDTILVLTKDSYYVAEYDDETDRITRYQRVLLEDLERIELGPEPSIFKSKRHCLRLHYQVNGLSGFFQMFRSTNTRFFNNMAVPIRNEEEAAESLKAMCEAFKVALCVKSLNVPLFEGKLERRRSKMPLAQGGGVISSSSGSSHRSRSSAVSFHLDLPSLSQMPRNISEGQLLNLRNVGSRALSNVTSQIAKLNPIRSVRSLGKRPNGSNLTATSASATSLTSTGINTLAAVAESAAVGMPSFHMDSSSDSEDDSFRRMVRNQQHTGSYQHSGQQCAQPQQQLYHGSLQQSTDRTLSSDYSECSDLDEHELISDSLEHINDSLQGSQDKLLESCGILATSPSFKNMMMQNRLVYKNTNARHVDVDDFVLDAMKRASIRHVRRHRASSKLSLTASNLEVNRSPGSNHQYQMSMPQIQISSENLTSASSQPEVNCAGRPTVVRKLSKSSEDLEIRSTMNMACSTCEVSHLLVQEELPLETSDGMSTKMKTSHSESAIQDFSFTALHLPNPLASPIVIKKDLVLSPLSRIAKGVQNLGMNLRPSVRREQTPEEYELIKERRKNCRTRIVDL